MSAVQFVWCGAQRCEERDGSGSLSNGKQFFPLGQVNFASGTPTNYFYTQDHLGSTRELTKTVSGTTTIEAQYAYDPYGIATKLQGSQDADFQYAGYYTHARSGLNLTLFRQYNPGLGRWLSRDPIGERGGVNLYGYVGGNPISFIDPSGLQLSTHGEGPVGPALGTLHAGDGGTSDALQLHFDKSTGILDMTLNGAPIVSTRAESGGHLGDPIPNGYYDVTSNPSSGPVQFFGLERHDLFGPSDYTFNDFFIHGQYRLHDGTVTAGCINVNKDKDADKWKVIDSTLRSSPDMRPQTTINSWWNPTSKSTVTHYGTLRVTGK